MSDEPQKAPEHPSITPPYIIKEPRYCAYTGPPMVVDGERVRGRCPTCGVSVFHLPVKRVEVDVDVGFDVMKKEVQWHLDKHPLFTLLATVHFGTELGGMELNFRNIPFSRREDGAPRVYANEIRLHIPTLPGHLKVNMADFFKYLRMTHKVDLTRPTTVLNGTSFAVAKSFIYDYIWPEPPSLAICREIVYGVNASNIKAIVLLERFLYDQDFNLDIVAIEYLLQHLKSLKLA